MCQYKIAKSVPQCWKCTTALITGTLTRPSPSGYTLETEVRDLPEKYNGDPEHISSLTFDRHQNYVNPGAASLLKFAGMEYPEWEAEGCFIRDVAGNEFLDFVAGYGVFSLGHRHPDVVEAIKNQLDRLTLKTHYFLNIELGEICEMLSTISPGDLQYSFLCNSGTEAVEGALKAARIHTRRKRVIGTMNGFHGKTFGSLSASGRDVYKQDFQPLLEGFITVPYGDAKAIDAVVDDTVAAVIVEVVQGEGGINVAPPGYMTAIRQITKDAGALLIVDEVRTGLGRTGKMFACEHENIKPDLLTMAKALGGGVMPIGAFLGTPEIWESLFGENPYLHSTTFGGNPLACTAGIAAIKATQRLNLPAQSAKLGDHLLESLTIIKQRFPLMIADVRGLGLLAGVEFASADIAKLVIAACARAGLLAAYSLNNPLVVRIEPPLIIEQELLDKGIAIFENAVQQTSELIGSLEPLENAS